MMPSPEYENGVGDEMVKGKSLAAQSDEDNENKDEDKDEEAMLCIKRKSFCICIWYSWF